MQPRSLLNATLIVGIGYVLSNLAGFAQRIVVTAQFGTGADYDAFNVAARVPELLFSMLAGGALASAFIPLYAGILGKGQTAHAWRLAGYTTAAACLAVGVGSAIAFAFAPALITLITAPSYENVELAAQLMRVMLISPVVFAASGLLMGVLQSNHAFVAPAFAPAVYQLGIMLGAILLSPALGIFGVAVGVVFGSVLHLGVQLPSLRRVLRARGQSATDSQAHVRPPVRTDLLHIGRLMLPRVVGLGAAQLNFIVNTWIASGSGEGAVSALALGFAILLLPIAAIAQSQGATLFPTLSAHAARGEMDLFAARLLRALGVVIALSAPATVGLIVLGYPLVALLFQRGAFTEQSTRDVSLALALFAIGLVGHCTLEMTTRGFYALKDTARPVLVAIGGVALNVALSLTLAAAFASRGWPEFGGVALANSVATLIEAGAMYAWLKRRASMAANAHLGRAMAKAWLAAAGMGAVVLAWLQVAGVGWLGTLSAMALGAATYFGLALLLRSDEARDAAQLVLRRVNGLRAARG